MYNSNIIKNDYNNLEFYLDQLQLIEHPVKVVYPGKYDMIPNYFQTKDLLGKDLTNIWMVSHIWEDETYPDPESKQINILKQYQYGFVYDYSSLPQRNSCGEISVSESRVRNFGWGFFKYLYKYQPFIITDMGYFNRCWPLFEFILSNLFASKVIVVGEVNQGLISIINKVRQDLVNLTPAMFDKITVEIRLLFSQCSVTNQMDKDFLIQTLLDLIR